MAARQTDPNAVIGRVRDILSDALATPLDPGLHLVATPIGNLADLTVRAITVLARADVIFCEDTRHSRTLVAHYAIAGPLKPYHEHNAEHVRPDILRQLAGGHRIALISDAGTPLVSDPGYKLVREALDAGYRVTSVPGPSAVLAALAQSGLPTDAFLFAGFLPPKSAARRTRLAEIGGTAATLVLFEAPSRVAATLGDIAAVLGTREVAVARELTKLHEEVRRGSAGDLATTFAETGARGEFVILVAPGTTAEPSDDDINARLTAALEMLSLRDAVQAVSEAHGVPRARVYDLALAIKRGGGVP